MSGGLKGMSRLPGDTVRARRNATKFASDFTSLLGDGLTVDTSLIVVDLAADKGLEFVTGDLATKIQSPLICDASGLGIDPGNGLEISGTELVVDLAATPGLEFSGGDLICKVAAPIALDATGIHLDYTTGLTLDGTDLVVDDTVFVPYTGATAEVDLGAENLVTTGTITAGAGTTGGLKAIGVSGIPPVQRGGHIILDYGNGISNNYIFVNNARQIVFSDVPQTGAGDTGSQIYVDVNDDYFAAGDGRFGDVNTYWRLQQETVGGNPYPTLTANISGESVGLLKNGLYLWEGAYSPVLYFVNSDLSKEIYFSYNDAVDELTLTSTSAELKIEVNSYFLDDTILYFGTGKDASIYYDGSHLWINSDEVGTGSLKIGDAVNYIEIEPDGDILFHGTANFADNSITTAKLAGSITRTKMIEEPLTRYQIPLFSCRNIDGSFLDTAGGAGKFKIVGGGWGAGDLQLRTETTNSDTKTDYLRLEYMLPPEYVAGADVRFSVTIDYVEDFAIDTGTVDIEAYEIDDNGAAGGDINSTGEGNWYAPHGGEEMTFVITPTNLVAGDRLGILLKLVVEDGMGNSYAWIGSMEMKLDIKG